MTRQKTLVGPGYYNIQHASDRAVPSFYFDLEISSVLKEKNLAECVRESKQIDKDRETRHKKTIKNMKQKM